MNKYAKFMLVALLLFLMIPNTLINAQSINSSSQPQIENYAVEKQINSLSVGNWIFNAFQYVATSTSDFWVYHSDPAITRYQRSTLVSSGAVKFNTGNVGPIVRKELVLNQYAGQYASIYGTRTPLITGKIAISVRHKGGQGNIVFTDVVTPNEMATFNPNTLGQYWIEWSTTDAATWDLHFLFTHRYDPNGPTPTFTKGNSINETNLVTFGNKVYRTPSFSHEAAQTVKTTQTYTMSDLDKDLWDESLQIHVNNFKSLNPGDNFILKDQIRNISYNPQNDTTKLVFLTEKGEVPWEFKGNLTNRVKIGDYISFKLKVVSVGGNIETLNYLQSAESSNGANFEEFIA
ncbi:hypothetical protein NQ117_20610 [Paenibacillus sp. SC116]|uniref:hypothetical protein n=1 Tax=Paenibacillus sp. SC116 TaxID=2968986 RepID=UPI00215A8993|nr:hypothetical protein [Paenibacillus sp. SC116]MCR8846087.1 hypothetical protein [Paenibacillus sp. SC116]